MKKVNVVHPYSHGLEAVFNEFCDPDFYIQKFEWCGDRNVVVKDHGQDDDSFWIVTEREVPADVPGVLKKVLGEWNKVTQKERWTRSDDGLHNELELISDAVPMNITGSMFLSGDDNQCENQVEMRLDANIPLLGGALEKFAAGQTRQNLDYEFDFISQYMDL